MSSKLKNGIILLGILALGGFGYYLYTQKSSGTLHNEEVKLQENIGTERFLDNISDLGSIEVGEEFFVDPRFTSLKNMTPDVVALPVGQENPFSKN